MRADAVLGVAALHLQQLRAEAERERQHADAVPARPAGNGQLVDEHEHAEHEQRTPVAWSQSEPLTFNSNSRASSARASRAQRVDAAGHPPSVAAGSGRVRVHRLLRSPAECAVKPSRPSRKDATATSLAAFSTTGRLRSASSARYARPQAREVVPGRLVEFERLPPRQIEERHRRVPAIGIRERVLNRQPHVGDAHLRDDRAVLQLDHRVHDRLRMHDDVDLRRRRRRTASAPRSPRGPCSSASPSRS